MERLDRLRTQPRHKHPDPAVRLGYVGELPLEERDQLTAIAREDDDARVRRAAVGKLMAPDSLMGVARTDHDDTVRAEAGQTLRDRALAALQGLTGPASLPAGAPRGALGHARAAAR